ncbi:MAG TPA: PPOX class F420-dependent oxidoreductase [Pseudonocardiaceae bacterium]|nr:PPOX class F420-dependent oxidoreductase [Pseudonocardiaceae bacterium]
MPSDLDRLAAENYVLLTTFRKDGSAVPTPVWVARDGDELLVYSAPDAGKVKRIRRDGTVRVGACDVRGRPKGDDVPGHARLLDDAGVRRTLDLIKQKYGLLARITMLGSKLRRRALPGGIAIKLE